MVSNNVLFKGALITSLFWWVWFGDRKTKLRDREFILSGFAMSVATLATARTLALSLPFRERPRFMPVLGFRMPAGGSDTRLIHWSSFPSDNAALYFSLATCLFFISRRLGILAYCHALLLVCLPRIYLGLHYPSDILGGALLGIGVASLSSIKALRSAIACRPLRWLESSPSSFYSCFYFAVFLLATEFEPLRGMVMAAWKLMHGATP